MVWRAVQRTTLAMRREPLGALAGSYVLLGCLNGIRPVKQNSM